MRQQRNEGRDDSGLRGWLRGGIICAGAAAAAALLVQFSFLAKFEATLADHFRFSVKMQPDAGTVLAVVDEAAVRRTGKYPFDRAELAKTLDFLDRAGARRIYIDVRLTNAEDSQSDKLLEEALERLGPQRVALPANSIYDAAGRQVISTPLPRFARNATVVSTALNYDTDNRVRRVSALPGHPYKLAARWLNDPTEPPTQSSLAIDYSYDPGLLKRVPLGDISTGNAGAAQFAGKNIIIGLQVSDPQFIVYVPAYTRLARIDVHALAVETLHANRQLAQLPGWAVMLGLLALCALGLALMAPLSPIAAFSLAVLGGAGWVATVDQLQAFFSVALPVLAPPLSLLLAWQALKLPESALGAYFSQQKLRISGAGRNALLVAAEVMAGPAAVFDQNGILLGANKAFGDTGLQAVPNMRVPHVSEVIVSDIRNSSGERDETRHRQLAFENRSSGKTNYFGIAIRWVDTMSGPLAIAALTDVTEARRRENELQTLAFRDSLTGLSNRVAFHARLTALEKHGREKPFGVLLIDLDGFKQVNDTLGHHAGDKLLQGVARRMERLVGKDDFVARLGGDEFAILAMTGNRSDCAAIARRLITSLSEPFGIDGQTIRVGASVGVAMCPADHREGQQALKLADAAMYEAKKFKPAFAFHGMRPLTAGAQKAS